jgi:hypothetical protein
LGVLAPLFYRLFIYHFDKSTPENRLKTPDIAMQCFWLFYTEPSTALNIRTIGSWIEAQNIHSSDSSKRIQQRTQASGITRQVSNVEAIH